MGIIVATIRMNKILKIIFLLRGGDEVRQASSSYREFHFFLGGVGKGGIFFLPNKTRNKPNERELWFTGTIAFGILQVRGRSLVASPPTKITALITTPQVVDMSGLTFVNHSR